MRRGYLLSTVVIALSVQIAGAQTDQDRALAVVKDVLPLVCGEYPEGGSSQKVEIKGEAKASLSGLLRKLTDLGIEGAGEFNSQEYIGVLQSEIGSEIKDVRDCRKKVYDDFKKAITEGNLGKISINTTGDKNATIVDSDNNTVNIK